MSFRPLKLFRRNLWQRSQVAMKCTPTPQVTFAGTARRLKTLWIISWRTIVANAWRPALLPNISAYFESGAFIRLKNIALRRSLGGSPVRFLRISVPPKSGNRRDKSEEHQHG